MAYIKTLKDNELIGGQDNTDVYPVSTSQAIYRQNPDGSIPNGVKQRLEESLQNHEADAKELHRKAERLVVYLTNNKNNQTLEITGNSNTMTLTGSAAVETYGDEPSESITPEEMTVKRMTVTSNGTTLYDESVVNTTYTLPNAVGEYIARFDCTYNGIPKYAQSNTNVNLRKYFGFAAEAPTDVTTLGTSHFSNSVGCTVTIPASGTGFKYIYFAIPKGMLPDGVKPTVLQPDALNAPLEISSQLAIINRIIGGSSYEYRLFKTVDEIDASVKKRLTIS